MKFDTTLEVVNVLGEPVVKDAVYKCGRCNYQGLSKGKSWTVLNVCIESLDFVPQDEKLTGEEKYKRHKLMDKLASVKDGKVELDALEDVPLLKDCIENFCGVTLYGFMYKQLEKISKSKDDKK